MSFFSELKRRNVFRVGVAYVVTAWLVLQVTDVLISLLELPNGTGRLVFFILVIGFPLAIFASWVFEITPEGNGVVLEENDHPRRDLPPDHRTASLPGSESQDCVAHIG